MQLDSFINIRIDNELTKMKVQVPLMELIKIPTWKEKAKKILGLYENEGKLMMFQGMNQEARSGACSSFYMSLLVDNLLLHDCTLDSGASINVKS